MRVLIQSAKDAVAERMVVRSYVFDVRKHLNFDSMAEELKNKEFIKS